MITSDITSNLCQVGLCCGFLPVSVSVSGPLSCTRAGPLCLSLYTLPVLCVAFVFSLSPHMHTDVPLLTACSQVEMRW